MNQLLRRNVSLVPIRIKKDLHPFPNNESFYIDCPKYKGKIDNKSRILSNDSSFLNYSKCNNIKKGLIKRVRKKYNSLIKGLDGGSKLENEIEEEKIRDRSKIYKKPKKYRKTLNNSSSMSTITCSQNITTTKKSVIYDKPEEDHTIIKKFEDDGFVKIPIKKQVYSKKELYDIVRIQTKFRGFRERDIKKQLDRLRVKECLLELFCLLVNRNYYNVKKREALKKLFLADENPDARCRVVNELEFKDKITIKLIGNYYNVTGVKNKF